MELVLRAGAFAGETHIVTGAAQGIGNRVAAVLAAHGAKVALVDLDPARLEDAKAEMKSYATVEPMTIAANVAQEQDVRNAVAAVMEATGQINGLVNVAGITRDARIVKKSYDDFKAVLGVHLHGTFLFTREVAFQDWHNRFNANGKKPLRDGVNRFIVNFSSVSARNGNIGQIDYTAAKGAIESMTKTTAREYAAYGARVNAISPGPVNTPMLAGVGADGIEAMSRATLIGRVCEPVEMARTVVALADGKLMAYVTGIVLQANGGLRLE
ncbi:MAG TPA: SDR family oxidoreductase [Candidatus Binatia bacterium]|nr:SDR family oxidoreductase [Candidatus Binatia bacterium]